MREANKCRRIGRVQIADDFIEHIDEQLLYELAERFPLFPLRSEHHFDTRSFQITGLSPLFDEIADGELVPGYHFNATIRRDETTGKYSLKDVSVKRAE